MNNNIRWKPLLAGGAAALLLTFGVAVVYPQVSQAVDSTPAAPEQRQRGGADVDPNALLAGALGITTDKLQAAYKQAAGAALDQAVKDELLTQTQADALRQRLDADGEYGFRGLGFGHFGRFGPFGSTGIDFEALLADALGIKVEALQAAEEKAQQTALDQAVEAGELTQEQADLAQARRAFHDYLAEQQPSVEELLKQAVAAGAITQTQADLLLENQPSGPWMDGGSMRGQGMMAPGWPWMGRGPGHDGAWDGPRTR